MRGALKHPGFGFRQARQGPICIGIPRHLTIRSSRPHVVASAMCFTLRLHTSAAPPRVGLTQALGFSIKHKDDHMSESKAGVATTAAGGIAGAAGSVGAVAVSGTVSGLGAAGITSGLAAIGSVVGGGMAAGLAVVAIAPLATAGAGYGIFRAVKRARKGHWG